MKRRRLLASLGAAAGTPLLAGCPSMFDQPGERQTGTPSDQANGTTAGDRTGAKRRFGFRFDRVVDAVADLGADPDGTEPIDPLIEKHYVDGTLIEFPPGSYLVEESHTFEEGADTWGMVGTGNSRRDVEFVFPEGNQTAKDPDNQYVLNVRTGRNHVLGNMMMQQTRDRVTGVGFIFVLSDGLHVENLEFAGFNPVSGRNPGACLIPDITDVRGTGTVRNFVCTGGGVQDTYPARKVGILCGPFHVGELRFEGHDIRNMGSHPHYTSNHRGAIKTKNCFFKNNDNTNIRISGGLNGGHIKKDSWVKNCTVVVDIDDAKYLPKGERYEFVRGIKLDYGEDVLVENTDVVFKSTPSSPYCVGVQFNHGRATFRQVRIHSDVNGVGPLFEAQENEDPVTLENVSITGTASEFYDTEAAVSLRGRNKSVLRNSCIHLKGGNQNGIAIKNAQGCRVENVSVGVPGKQFVSENAEPVLTDVRRNGNCNRASANQ